VIIIYKYAVLDDDATARREAPSPCCSHQCFGSAVVPQIDHRVGKSFERVVDLTQVLEAKQQAAELENHLAGLLPPPGRATELK
jgi:hypothetical protein